MDERSIINLLYEMRRADKYSIVDLFKIRDALNILAKYDLHDEDLLCEVNKFIKQKLDQ